MIVEGLGEAEMEKAVGVISAISPASPVGIIQKKFTLFEGSDSLSLSSIAYTTYMACWCVPLKYVVFKSV